MDRSARRSHALTPERRRRLPLAAIAGGAVALGVILPVLAAPLLAPFDPTAVVGAPAARPAPPFALGTGALGQDLLSQLLHGGRSSLAIAGAVALLSTVLSAVAGIAAGAWRRGGLVLAVVDLFLAVPAVPLLVLLTTCLGTGAASLVAALALVGWAAFARIVRAQVAATLARDHIEAARALGASAGRIARTCVLPEIVPVLFTKFLLTVRWAVLMDATLGLLGLTDPGRVSWGSMLHEAFGDPLLFVTGAWLWWAVPPALAIATVSLGLAAIGQDVDVWLNPHARA
jgi:peptide/nickel transport system permease protein